MPKYYEGEAVVKAFTETTNLSELARQILASMKEADVAPVIHAHWIHKFQYANHDHCYICSACGMSERVPYRGYEKRFLHCHCGAKMDEEVKEDDD